MQTSSKWYPMNGTRAEKMDYCRETFRGWEVLATELMEPRETKSKVLYGYLAVNSPGDILLIGEVVRWKKFEADAVRIDFWRGVKNVYYGKRKNDLHAFMWWAVEVWLQAEERLKVTVGVPKLRKLICENWEVMDEPELTLYPKDREERGRSRGWCSRTQGCTDEAERNRKARIAAGEV